MAKNPSSLSLLARLCLIATSVTLAVIGLTAVVTRYAPERSTRFGLTEPLLGSDAISFGIVCILMALIPLLPFFRNKQKATMAGILIGICLIASIFYLAYT
ncbi:MAG: hypothetical protein IPJ05_10515 [Nitrosomonas sp.]|nr:hypothetical protein [Nitrosomonas sp.]